MVKIGVLGTGHLGKIHLKLIREIKEFDLVGFYDPNDENANQAVREFGLKRYDNLDELIEAADAVDIVTNTMSHYECAVKAIKKSRHVFVEKPLANTLEEAHELLKLAEEARIKAQVGHVERFNPAFLAIKSHFLNPMFIETHRLAQFNPRGTDVPVVLDLMIHDIDIILNVVKSTVKRISASGVAVISTSPDIANARLEFDNGCVANITASRISLKQMRKMRMFQRDGYISIDFLDKKAEVIRLSDRRDSDNPFAIELNTGDKETKVINFERPEVKPTNAIKMELELFYDAIVSDKEPPVTFLDGYHAMNIAYQIMAKIERTTS